MTTMLRRFGCRAMIAGGIFSIGFGFALPAQAQLLNQPWARAEQNRASIASLIYQVEQAKKNGTTSSTSSGSVTNLVCGGAGGTSANGSSSCIILNNTVADIGVDQYTKGNQTADNNEQTTTTSGADDVLATLNADD
jgi:hypothetical protein